MDKKEWSVRFSLAGSTLKHQMELDSKQTVTMWATYSPPFMQCPVILPQFAHPSSVETHTQVQKQYFASLLAVGNISREALRGVQASSRCLQEGGPYTTVKEAKLRGGFFAIHFQDATGTVVGPDQLKRSLNLVPSLGSTC
jgi:hypothetical protein